MTIVALLESGLDALDFPLPASVRSTLPKFLHMLIRWNQTYNLTAIRDPADMVTKHLLDSLVVSPWIQGPSVLDVGSGAGLPGIPLAMAHPEVHFTLIDSAGKKTRFMAQVKAELGLANVSVIHGRVEQLQGSFDQIVSRAFSSLTAFVSLTKHALAPGGEWLAMKGQVPADELSLDAIAGLGPDVVPLRVPLLPDARHLVRMKFQPAA